MREWFISVKEDDVSLGAAFEEMQRYGLDADSIPLLVKLVENPEYRLLKKHVFFNGATTLRQHDFIHVVLGRGMGMLDEAFVLGFTAGSTQLVSKVERKLYCFIAKYLYPKVYRFNVEACKVYYGAVELAESMGCASLDKVDFESLKGLSLSQVRCEVGLDSVRLIEFYNEYGLRV